jgi:RNA polymerase sigma factor (sigma-70 family)
MAQRKIDYHMELIARLREGDPGAQFEAYESYKVAMYNTALRIVMDRAEAEDVLQEAFLAAFTKISSFTGESTFGAWLKSIVVNKSINALSKIKASLSFKEQAAEEVAATAKAGLHDSDDSLVWNVDQIKKAVDQLPDGYRVVFTLYLFEGYDHREIAEIIGITEGGSKSQFNRAKSKLREILTAMSYV